MERGDTANRHGPGPDVRTIKPGGAPRVERPQACERVQRAGIVVEPGDSGGADAERLEHRHHHGDREHDE